LLVGFQFGLPALAPLAQRGDARLSLAGAFQRCLQLGHALVQRAFAAQVAGGGPQLLVVGGLLLGQPPERRLVVAILPAAGFHIGAQLLHQHSALGLGQRLAAGGAAGLGGRDQRFHPLLQRVGLAAGRFVLAAQEGGLFGHGLAVLGVFFAL